MRMTCRFYRLFQLVLLLSIYSCNTELSSENSEFKDGVLVDLIDGHPLSGDWLETKNGVVLSQGHFVEGKREGLFISFADDGRITDSINYIDGRKHGVEVQFDSAGTVRKEIPFIFGKEDGVVREYSFGGELERETLYRDGIRNGLSVGYYKNGQVKDSVTFIDNREEGVFIEFFLLEKGNDGDSLRVKKTGTFREGFKSGVWKENLTENNFIEREYGGIIRLDWTTNECGFCDFVCTEYEDNEYSTSTTQTCYVDGKKCGKSYQVEKVKWDDEPYKWIRSGNLVNGNRQGDWSFKRIHEETLVTRQENIVTYHNGLTEDLWSETYRNGRYKAEGLEGIWNINVKSTSSLGDSYSDVSRHSSEVLLVKGLSNERYQLVSTTYKTLFSNFVFPTFTPTGTPGIYDCRAKYCGGQEFTSIALQKDDHFLSFRTKIDGSKFSADCLPSEAQALIIEHEVTMIRVAPQEMKPSLTDIESTNTINSTSSCVVVDADNGYLVTNYHAVESRGKIVVLFGGAEHDALVVAKDEANDLALLKLAEPLPNLISLNVSTNDGLGSKIYAVGYPLQKELGLDIKVTEGLISSLSYLGNTNMYQVSCPITFGNSGGALLDETGNLAGVTQGGFRPNQETENVNGAVKAHSIVTLAQGASGCKLSLGDHSKKIDFGKLDHSVLVLRNYSVE